ncbi:MAG: SIMPL domain-containing protein [Sphingomonadaceae bacterium]|nr:SIMPL domain-containing protein [Sphingomonadaceae bacterium]
MRLLIPLAIVIAAPAMAQPLPPPAPTVEFPVTAIVERAPDRADFTAGVVTQASTAAAASRDNAQRMAKVVAAIRAAGVPDRDVQTAGINLSPQYDYVPNRPPRLTGYQASNTVRIRLRELDRAGAVLDSLIATGANQVNGPDFGLQDEDAALDDARRDAVAKAKLRADLYARALGHRSARIQTVSEGASIEPVRPMPMARMLAKSEDASTPVQPGRLTLSVTLQIRAELD